MFVNTSENQRLRTPFVRQLCNKHWYLGDTILEQQQIFQYSSLLKATKHGFFFAYHTFTVNLLKELTQTHVDTIVR